MTRIMSSAEHSPPPIDFGGGQTRNPKVPKILGNVVRQSPGRFDF